MFQIPIDAQVRKIVQGVLQGNPSSREIAVALEANQAYIEYLDWLKDNVSVSNAVLVEVDGVQVQFKNSDDFSNWLSEKIK